MRLSDLLEGLAWFSMVVVVALYIADGRLSDVSSLQEVIVGLGIVAGLIGSNAVMIMLLLVARIPVLNTTLGTDRTLTAHRWLGKPALYLLLAHAALLIIGYGLALGRDPITEFGRMWTQVAYLPLAIVALGLLTVVVIVSLAIVRRRLRYESWFVVHLLTYAAVLLALPHQFLQGGLFAEGTAERWYWLTAWALTLGAIAVFRVALPVVRNARHRLRVTAVAHEGPGVVSITMSGRMLEKLQVRGGQYFLWRFDAPGLRWEGHPYSLSAAPDGHSLRITTRDLGNGSRRLLSLKVGTRVYFEGPYGLFTTVVRTGKDAVLIGAGIGITPIRSVVESMLASARKVTVILRANEASQLYLRQEFTALKASGGIDVLELIGPPPARDAPPTWLPSEPGRSGSLATLVPQLRDADVYVCGPAPWARLVIRDARAAGVPRSQIHTERFTW